MIMKLLLGEVYFSKTGFLLGFLGGGFEAEPLKIVMKAIACYVL